MQESRCMINITGMFSMWQKITKLTKCQSNNHFNEVTMIDCTFKLFMLPVHQFQHFVFQGYLSDALDVVFVLRHSVRDHQHQVQLQQHLYVCHSHDPSAYSFQEFLGTLLYTNVD